MITVDELMELYRSSTGANAEEVGAIDVQKLVRVVARPQKREAGLPAYPTLFGKIAALIQAILVEQPTSPTDAKVALLCMEHLLERHGYDLQAPEKAVEQLFTGVELGITTTHRISIWLKQHTRRRGRG